MKASQIVLTIIVAIAASLLSTHFLGSTQDGASSAKKESVYDRVMRTGTLRCGYVIYPPSVMKDPNSGKLSGIFYDVVNEAGKNLDLKVEWKEETGWSTMIEGLVANRYDAICSGVWANATRARAVDFITSLYYSGVGVWTKASDERFNDGPKKLNNPNFTLAVMDGETSAVIAKNQFPQAKTLSVPQLNQISELLLNVQSSKADATFVESYVAQEFLDKNPGTIKNISADRPMMVFPNNIIIAKGEDELKNMLNTALEELINRGTIEQMFTKYHVPPKSLYLPAYEYRP